MRILVTGASGFVGSHVVRKLVADGHEVTALARPASSFWRLEDLDGTFRVVRWDTSQADGVRSSLGDWKPEACVHLAWYAVPGEYLHSTENTASLVLSLRLLEELAAAGCGRVVMTGTCFEYDTDAGYLREDGPKRPATIYAAAKLAAGQVGTLMAAKLGIGFAWARLFYLYGPFEDERRLVPAVIRALLAGREFPATSGTQGPRLPARRGRGGRAERLGGAARDRHLQRVLGRSHHHRGGHQSVGSHRAAPRFDTAGIAPAAGVGASLHLR